MNIKQAVKKAGSLCLDTVKTIHETEGGVLFGCKAEPYDCANKQPNGHIKRAGLCIQCPRFKLLKGEIA